MTGNGQPPLAIALFEPRRDRFDRVRRRVGDDFGITAVPREAVKGGAGRKDQAGSPAAVAVWHVWPSAFIGGFAILAAFHFSGDPDGAVPLSFRVVYGGLIIVLPALVFAPAVAHLLATLMPAATATTAATALRWLAIPWLLAALAMAAGHARRDAAASRELLAITVLAVFAPQMWSFTIFFCFMHSARHVLRVRGSWDHVTWRSLARAAALPLLATGVALAVGWRLLADPDTSTRAVQLIFVALAALTVPHVLLVERLRLADRAVSTLPPAQPSFDS